MASELTVGQLVLHEWAPEDVRPCDHVHCGDRATPCDPVHMVMHQSNPFKQPGSTLQDWRAPSPQLVAATTLRRADPGTVLLFFFLRYGVGRFRDSYPQDAGEGECCQASSDWCLIAVWCGEGNWVSLSGRSVL